MLSNSVAFETAVNHGGGHVPIATFPLPTVVDPEILDAQKEKVTPKDARKNTSVMSVMNPLLLSRFM